MDTDGPGIDPYTEVIPPDMVLTYASYDDSNIESDSDREYEPEDNDDDISGAKELPGGTSIYYSLPEAKILFAARLGKTAYDSIAEQISICDAVHNGWSLLHHVIYGYNKATENSMSNYYIHRTKIKCYYIA